MKNEQNIRIATDIREIFQDNDDDWNSVDVMTLPQSEIDAMVKDDPDPFFAILDIAFAVKSKNGRIYTDKSIYDVKENALGVQGYLGHQRLEDRDYEYRIPQLKIIKTRVRETINSKTSEKNLAAQGKAYVSRMATVTRTNIREKMAGPVSIDVVAILELDRDGEGIIVTDIPKVRFVDLCNPGTEGIEGTGVTSIVSEMVTEEGGFDLADKLTKEDLLSSYKAEIREIVKSEISPLKEENVKIIREMETKLKDTEDKSKEKDEKIVAHEQTIQEMQKSSDTLKDENQKLQSKLNLKELEEYKVEVVQGLDVSQDIKEMITKKVDVSFDESMEKSKEVLKLNIESKYTEIQEIAKVYNVKDVTGGNPPKDINTKQDYKKELAKAILVDEE